MATLVVVSIIVLALIGVLLAGEVLVALLLFEGLRRVLQRLRGGIHPSFDRALALLDKINRFATRAAARIVRVATGAERVSDGALRAADRATWLLQHAVVWPLIGILAAVRGLRQGTRSWQALRHRRAAAPRRLRLVPPTPVTAPAPAQHKRAA